MRRRLAELFNPLYLLVALGVGLRAPSQPRLFAALPEALRALFESGIAAGGLTALILNVVMPKPLEPPRDLSRSVRDLDD